MQVLVGADPEVFVRAGGKFVSAHNMIAGSKHEPFPVQNGAVQVDGMALEFNITPASTPHDFVYNINTVRRQLERMIPKDHVLSISAAADFDPEYMAKQPEDAKKLGCEPDFNAYSRQINPSPEQHPTMRVAGGHVHLGWGEDFEPFSISHFDACCTVVKQLDFWLGLPSIILDHDTKRKQMYGKAGAFRPKPYGVEYRTLSNFWIENDDLIGLVFNNTKAGFTMLAEGTDLSEKYGDICQQTIDTNDKTRAINLCNTIGIPYKPRNWDVFKL